MIWIVCIFTILFSGCQQKPQERQYTEIISQAHQDNFCPFANAAKGMPKDPFMLGWVRPEGWQEEAGRHMRMVSFYQTSDRKAVDCSIIALRGPAGGLAANLSRWSAQIGIQASSDDLKHLTDSAQSLKTKDGIDVKVYDFSVIQPEGKASDKSMLVAPIALDDATAFVKMTGSLESIRKNRDNFLKLIKSIVRK